MKLLKYMLCASMCVSFGVAHAKWEPLGFVEKPILWSDDIELYGYMYNSEKDIDNTKALVRHKIDGKYYHLQYYITPRDCVTGQGILRVVGEEGSYSPVKFNLTDPDKNFIHGSVILICNKLFHENKFTESDKLKVEKNINDALKD